ncbi:MAG: homocysteine S-methyltransferase family protein [Luminiphilus sp.]
MISESVLLLDGGLGQELIHRSTAAAHHLWSLQVMLDEPQLVSDIHRDFCHAGAAIACLNTYAITRARLTRGGVAAPLDTLLTRARELAQAGIVESKKTDVALVSSLPPLVASYSPDTELPTEQMVAEYRELIDLQRPHVDGFLAETIASVNEAKAVLSAAQQSGSRIMLGLTVMDDDGCRLRSGEPLKDALDAAAAFEPLAIVINCSKPEAVSQAMPLLQKSGVPFGGFANGFTAVDDLKPGGVVDVLQAREDLGPEAYATHAANWLDAGATVIGGCCEVGPAHIQVLKGLIEQRGLRRMRWSDLTAR